MGTRWKHGNPPDFLGLLSKFTHWRVLRNRIQYSRGLWLEQGWRDDTKSAVEKHSVAKSSQRTDPQTALFPAFRPESLQNNFHVTAETDTAGPKKFPETCPKRLLRPGLCKGYKLDQPQSKMKHQTWNPKQSAAFDPHLTLVWDPQNNYWKDPSEMVNQKICPSLTSPVWVGDVMRSNKLLKPWGRPESRVFLLLFQRLQTPHSHSFFSKPNPNEWFLCL